MLLSKSLPLETFAVHPMNAAVINAVAIKVASKRSEFSAFRKRPCRPEFDVGPFAIEEFVEHRFPKFPSRAAGLEFAPPTHRAFADAHERPQRSARRLRSCVRRVERPALGSAGVRGRETPASARSAPRFSARAVRRRQPRWPPTARCRTRLAPSSHSASMGFRRLAPSSWNWPSAEAWKDRHGWLAGATTWSSRYQITGRRRCRGIWVLGGWASRRGLGSGSWVRRTILHGWKRERGGLRFAMPELPEVETTRRQIGKIMVGRRIEAVETTRPRLLLPHVTRRASPRTSGQAGRSFGSCGEIPGSPPSTMDHVSCCTWA